MEKDRSHSRSACTLSTWLAAWDSENHGWWDDAVKGNSALQSGLLRYEEMATLNEQSAVCIFFGMERLAKRVQRILRVNDLHIPVTDATRDLRIDAA